MKDFGFVLFGVAWIIAIASWFLAIAESIGIRRFWPFTFRTGVRVSRESHFLPPTQFAIGSEMETETGKLKVVAPGLCFFRFRVPWFGLHTPFPIKGSVRWEGPLAIVEGRIPLFSTLFLAAWLLGWTAGGLMDASNGQGIVVVLFGWAVAVGISIFSIPFELRRARKVFREFQRVLQRQGT